MSVGRRIGLFLLTNLAILLVLSVILGALGIGGMLDEDRIGIDYRGLIIIAAVIGFGGSLISLALSKTIAKHATGARVIEKPGNEVEQWLLTTVKRQADRAGVRMPDVAIYEAPEINAFATGARRNSALVAVSTGLLRNMTRDEAEAVVGHEVAHVANGDMVTLTLIQGVVNTFVIFFSRLIGYFVDRVVFKNERGHGPGFWIVTIVAQIVLGIIASMIVMWFSRWREFRADEGGARLASREKMIAALERLKKNYQPSSLPDQVEAFGINGNMGQGLKRLFMSHPPLDERIAHLRNLR
jgi:heat shock protein HtpX